MTTVIYDGECDFCKSCVDWVASRVEIEAIANQKIDPAKFGITREQCEKSVVVIDKKIYFGAKAVSYLLRKCKFRITARLLELSGPIGEFSYRYIASHRDGKLVAFLHFFIRKTIAN